MYLQDKTTLVILAAGMASRYGGNKQIESFGPSGETIMEYSIYDAIRAGFTRVLFIIKSDSADIFREKIESKLSGKIEVDYAYQSLESFSKGIRFNTERTKPFGTAHALLCCKEKLDSPFAVINADDFYGFDAFNRSFAFLTSAITDTKYACLGYALENTVSEYGAVTRGEININTAGEIKSITERKEILLKDSQIFSLEGGEQVELDKNTKVSMNFFCFTPHFIDWMENKYYQFLTDHKDELKAEFLIPEVADVLIKTGEASIQMIPTNAKWFGVTFKEDAAIVKEELLKLTNEGAYPKNLWK